MNHQLDQNSPYFIDNPKRVRDLQAAMAKEGLDAYLGSRPRTLSFLLDAFIPWRSYVVVPRTGDPVLYTFIVDATRVADETWLSQDNVRAYAPMGGQDPITLISEYLKDEQGIQIGRLGIEDGISTYTPEGNLSHYEYTKLQEALDGWSLVNAHNLVDELSFIKDPGTVARFREASRLVDIGQQAVYEALADGGWKNKTEAEIGGIGALAMRKAGSVSEWNFAGLNEISSGYRTALGACTPPTTKKLADGEPLMVDLHSMFHLALGDHSHNYLIGKASKRQRRHADNFVDLVQTVLDHYKEGVTPSILAQVMMDRAEQLDCSDFLLPGCEHGIGLYGDEWRIGRADEGPFPYWTNPDHVYQEGEMVICAMQYASLEESIGFRYENPIVIGKHACEVLSKFPLSIEEIN